MEYNRLVSYLYCYNGGIKDKNVGFAKAENRNGQLRLTLNLKGATGSQNDMGVYLFYRNGDYINGIHVGDMVVKSGQGDFKCLTSSNDVAQSGVAFGQMKGIFIANRGDLTKVYASEWDDKPIQINKLVFEGETPLDAGSRSRTERPVQAQPVREKAVPVVENVPVAAEPVPEVTPIAVEPVSAAIPITAELVDDPVLTAAEGKPNQSYQDMPADDSSVKSDSLEESQNQNKQTPDSWKKIFDDREKLLIFSDDDIYDCVEITPEDIFALPNLAWGLKNNEFLKYGYYNFRHLILGKKYNEKDNTYIIGVPGIYTRRDRGSASMYGFDRFRFSMRSDVRLNQFGYWYMEIKF